jgi:LacI family transcriptional regulator
MVTLALHRTHRTRISPQTRREILRAAREMGYEPRGVTTHTIAFVVDASDVWWGLTTNLLVYAERAMREHGFRMAVVMIGEEDLAAGKTLVTPKTADGAIFTEWHGGKIRRLISPEVPWVLAADEDGDLGEDVEQVAMDTVKTATRLTRYLCERGHERICLLTGSLRSGFHERLQRGVYQGLAEAGLPLDNLVTISATGVENERAEIQRKLIGARKRKTAPTAVVTGNMGSALVVVNQLQRAGCRLPEDMSLVTVVDRPHLTALQPAVTATTAASHSDAVVAVERLIQHIKEPGLAPQRVLIPGEIIERESVARIKL